MARKAVVPYRNERRRGRLSRCQWRSHRKGGQTNQAAALSRLALAIAVISGVRLRCSVLMRMDRREPVMIVGDAVGGVRRITKGKCCRWSKQTQGIEHHERTRRLPPQASGQPHQHFAP
jgi:hypothetical protein